MGEETWLSGRTVTLLINPTARGVPSTYHGGPVQRYLERQDVRVDVRVPDTRAAAVDAARRSAERGDAALFAVGGDGTMRDAAEGLAGSGTALAAIAGGTVNVWCREADIPFGIRAALDSHLAGQRLRIDLGRAGEHRFLLMASGGWDADIVKRVSQTLKTRIGDYAYIAQGARMLRSLQSRPMRLRTGITVEEHSTAIFILSNTRLYGGRVRFNPRATVTDGSLDLAVLCPRSGWEVARLALKTVLGRLQGDRAALFLEVTELALDTPGVPIQVDGDYIGDSPMSFGVDRGALLVSVPAGPLAPVFGAPDPGMRTLD